jgi:hypothetical protein
MSDRFSGIAQRLRASNTTLIVSGMADDTVSTVGDWIQASPAGVSVTLSITVPLSVLLTEMIS